MFIFGDDHLSMDRIALTTCRDITYKDMRKFFMGSSETGARYEKNRNLTKHAIATDSPRSGTEPFAG
ncbi:MAG: hypothetical protein CMD92_04420 [Gammaproteobacteria bacterium]|nr:hypothetical protein [Gammaproteobacteria bacterium]